MPWTQPLVTYEPAPHLMEPEFADPAPPAEKFHTLPWPSSSSNLEQQAKLLCSASLH